MSLILGRSCAVCGTRVNISKCAACQVMFYCGREHQAAHWPGQHKPACKALKGARADLKYQEAKLRSMPGDFITPPGATIFEEYAGHFWKIHETRPYMRARYALVEALLKIKTSAAVEAALSHLLDMLRLCRGDGMGVRDVVPALFLRLGRDQECYDFVKWWATTGQRGDYDWGNMNEPYLNLKDENAFELPAPFGQKFADVSPAISVTLLKIRILFDLRALKSATKIGERAPQEASGNIRNQMVGNIVQRRNIIEGKNLDSLIEDLQNQVSDMYHAIQSLNKYFWPALLKPGSNLTTRPAAYSRGSLAEMQIMLQYSYNSWVETPGAIDYIRTFVTDGSS